MWSKLLAGLYVWLFVLYRLIISEQLKFFYFFLAKHCYPCCMWLWPHLDMKKCVELYFSGHRLCNYGYVHVLIAQMAGLHLDLRGQERAMEMTVINLSSDTR